MSGQVHFLKTIDVYFDAVERGEKLFEVRRDDRGFQKGDSLVLQRVHKVRHSFGGRGGAQTSSESWSVEPGRTLLRRVTWILTGGQFGIEPGYVVMGLTEGSGSTEIVNEAGAKQLAKTVSSAA